jgi:hypothetical protein
MTMAPALSPRVFLSAPQSIRKQCAVDRYFELRLPWPTKLIALDSGSDLHPPQSTPTLGLDQGLEKKTSRALPSRRDEVILLL